MTQFYGFEGLNKFYKAKDGEDKARDEAIKEDKRREKFNELLRDKLDNVIEDSYATTLKDIDHISFIKPPVNKETGRLESFFIVPFYSKDGKQYSETLTLDNEGNLLGGKNVLKDTGNSKENIYEEVLYIAETVNQDFFVKVKGKILPPDKINPKNTKEDIYKEPKKPKLEKLTDPRRLDFMKKQKKIIFGFYAEEEGGKNFKKYFGFVFPKFLALDNEELGNAAFFKEIDEEIKIDEEKFRLPPERRMTNQERISILEKHWEPLKDLTRNQIVQVGADKKIHPHKKNEDWERIMQTEIDKRS